MNNASVTHIGIAAAAVSNSHPPGSTAPHHPFPSTRARSLTVHPLISDVSHGKKEKNRH
jgi:hypothetical protein